MDSSEDADLQEIKEYIPREEWDDLSEYEKLRYLNVKRNYDLLIASGLSSEYVPDFMEKHRDKKKTKKKTTVKKSFGSDNENDNKWLPVSSTRKKRKKKISKEIKEDDSNKVSENEDKNGECVVPRGLSICPSNIKGTKNGVWADICFPKGAQFGPYQEKHDNEQDKIKTKQKKGSFHTKETNWMNYINYAKNECDHNVEVCQYNGKIYYKVIKSIYPGAELLMWRGKEHAKQLGTKPFEKEKEEGEKSYECTICKETFSSLIILEIHKKIHPTILNGKYQCPRCEYSTDIKGNLKQHFKIHTSEKPFVCSRCNRAFVRKDILKTHETLVHFKNGNYACNVCGGRFVAKKSLENHCVIHTKEKPFQCNICEKRFTTGGTLKSHVKSVHLNIRPHQCLICKKRFSRKSNLKTHTFIHTKEVSEVSAEK